MSRFFNARYFTARYWKARFWGGAGHGDVTTPSHGWACKPQPTAYQCQYQSSVWVADRSKGL